MMKMFQNAYSERLFLFGAARGSQALIERGYRNVWTPRAELYHHESASRGFDNTPEKADRFQKEVDYMLGRWTTKLASDPFYNENLSLEIGKSFELAFPPRQAKPWVDRHLSADRSEVCESLASGGPKVRSRRAAE
jgi:hypothetical protein